MTVFEKIIIRLKVKLRFGEIVTWVRHLFNFRKNGKFFDLRDKVRHQQSFDDGYTMAMQDAIGAVESKTQSSRLQLEEAAYHDGYKRGHEEGRRQAALDTFDRRNEVLQPERIVENTPEETRRQRKRKERQGRKK